MAFSKIFLAFLGFFPAPSSSSPGKTAVVLRWGFVPCILLARKAVMGSASPAAPKVPDLPLQIIPASMQELAAPRCFHAKKSQVGKLLREGV